MTAGLVIVLTIVGLRILYRVFAGTEERWREYMRRRKGSPRGRHLNEGFDLVHRGIPMWFHGFRRGDWNDPAIEVRAAVRVRPGLRVWISGAWGDSAVLRLAGEIRGQPRIEGGLPGEVRTDRPDVLATLDDLGRAWRRIAQTQTQAVIASDGRAVSCIVADPELTDEVLDAMLDAVAALAAWDDGYTTRLATLPGASPLPSHELQPAVSLEPDGLVVGVLDATRTVAHLDVHVDRDPAGAVRAMFDAAGDGELTVTPRYTRYAWTAIVERDPTRLRAAVEAIRALAGGTGPYR